MSFPNRITSTKGRVSKEISGREKNPHDLCCSFGGGAVFNVASVKTDRTRTVNVVIGSVKKTAGWFLLLQSRVSFIADEGNRSL